MQRIDYLPVEVIFNLLSLYRKNGGRNPAALREMLRPNWLRSLDGELGNSSLRVPRVSFWTRLCQAASLLDDDTKPYPTLLADEWFGWSLQDQVAWLLEAWLKVPGTTKSRNVRAALLKRIRQNIHLGTAHRQELVGLQALRICFGEHLTELGAAVLVGKNRELFAKTEPEPWHIAGNQLIVPFPPDWELLWKLDFYFDRTAAGIYRLDETALRLASQRSASRPGHPEINILQQGLGKPLPVELHQALAGQPTIRLLPGYVLEFSHADDLKKLRQSPAMRRGLDHVLSPLHVVLDPWRGYGVLQALYRKGLVSETELGSADQPPIHLPQQSLYLSLSDRAYLLSILLFSEGLQKTLAPPPGLLMKLTYTMDHTLRAAAAHKATQALSEVLPMPSWEPEVTPPHPPADELIKTLQTAVDRNETVDVLYQASSKHLPEYRHLTPLLVESRRARYYLVAYCHTRRANRTFRLDRLKLCGL